MGSEIIAAAVGGFAGWIAIQAATYFALRSRLVTYLVIQANMRLQAAHASRGWLEQLGRDHSVPGAVAKVAPRYSPDRAEDLHASRELILRYLRRPEIERVTKFLSYLWETEYLTEGVCEAIGSYKKRGTPLTADDCRYLNEKIGRVASIISKWPQSIRTLEELPMDYAGVQGPGSIKPPLDAPAENHHQPRW
jgi:hypothetical protein